MKFKFFHSNAFREMKIEIWELSHLYARNHVIWKLDQSEIRWFDFMSEISAEVKETLRS
jgi:hypothetical protein